MAKKYKPEEIEKIMQNLPEELKETFFSLETAETISNTCKTYGIIDERVGKIADSVGQVLMGLSSISEFQETIQKEVDLPPVLAQAIAQEINRFIFYPMKPALEQLYKIGISEEEKEKTPVAVPAPKTKGTVPVEAPVSGEEKPKAPAGKDVYREPTE